MCLWATTSILQIPPVVTALCGFAGLLLTGVLTWEDSLTVQHGDPADFCRSSHPSPSDESLLVAARRIICMDIYIYIYMYIYMYIYI